MPAIRTTPRRCSRAREHNVLHWAPKPGGESRADVAFRVRLAIDSAFREYRQNGRDTFVIVCHSVTVRQLVKSILNLPYEVSDGLDGPDNCDVRLIQRRAPGQPFADFGPIWCSGQEHPAQPIEHPTTQQMFATRAYTWKAPEV